MKEVSREKTVTEVMYYEAVDGTRFQVKEACEEYEKSAKAVLYKELSPYRIAETNEYNLYDEVGCEDHLVEVYNVENSDVLTRLNTLRQLYYKDTTVIPVEYIGKNVLVCWDCEHYFSWFYTIDILIDSIKKNYANLIAPKENN